MFYIHQMGCISPQQTFEPVDLEALHPVKDNKLNAVEPSYKTIPANQLRRMSKSVRMSIGAMSPFITGLKFDGVIIGTANAGMEESGRFLDQLVEYDEDTLSPGNFVLSTSNAIAAQISLMFGNTGFNNTHVAKGHAFENAILDAAMLLAENLGSVFILGGVDEIASNNYLLDKQSGWFKSGIADDHDFYEANSPGTIPGEGSALFTVSNLPAGALAQVKAVQMINTDSGEELAESVQQFIDRMPAKPNLLLSGENGNSDTLPYIDVVERIMGADVAIARFKHMTGEYPTASAFALWMAVKLLSGQTELPSHAIKSGIVNAADLSDIVIYNLHKGVQHSLIWVSKV